MKLSHGELIQMEATKHPLVEIYEKEEKQWVPPMPTPPEPITRPIEGCVEWKVEPINIYEGDINYTPIEKLINIDDFKGIIHNIIFGQPLLDRSGIYDSICKALDGYRASICIIDVKEERK